MGLQNTLNLIAALVLATEFVTGANILYLNVVTSPSHHIWNSALANGLAVQGHNVTMLSPDKDESSPNGVHYIHLEGLYNEKYHDIMKTWFSSKHERSPLKTPNLINEYQYRKCEDALKTNGFKLLLEYPVEFRFDLVVHDFAMGPCLLGFVHKFKSPPLVAVTAYGHPAYLTAIVGGHQYYSYVPHMYNSAYDGDMNIFQRLYNCAVHVAELFSYSEIFNRRYDKLLKQKFGSNLPSVGEIEQRTAIALVNTNPAFDYAFPLPENVIQVGGLQVKNTKPLPKDLEDYITSAKKGAVLFSLGSNVRSSSMTEDKQRIILDAFEQFPDYNFLWKFENSSIDLKLPKNVMIQPWLPQSDLLAHPKLRAFFTHSGLLSTHEAIWRGVPILSMPFTFDQEGNSMKSIRNGFAEAVDFHTMTTEIIKEKLGKILDEPKYYANAKKISARFRDQKETPLERALWNINWLLRNSDCEYLKSPVLRLGFIVGNSFDLIAIVSITLFIFFLFIFKACFPKSHRVIPMSPNTEQYKNTKKAQ